MRQIAVVAPLLILLLFVLYMFTPTIQKGVPPEQFIGQDALLVVTQYDLEKRIEEFVDSPLGAAIQGIDFPGIAVELEIQGVTPDQVQSVREQIVEVIGNPLFKIIFGREISIVLSQFSVDPAKDFGEQILNNTLLICRPKHNARLIDMIGKLVLDKEKISDVTYGVHTIKRLPLEPNRTLNVARVKELFLLSFDERLLRRSLDRYDTGEQTLANDPRYWDTREQFFKASFFSYINLELIKNSVAETFPGEYQEYAPFLGDLENYRWYRQLFFGAWQEEDHVFEKVMISYDSDTTEGSLPVMTTEIPGIARTLNRVSEDTVLYYWSSHFDLKPLLPYLQAGSGDSPSRNGEPGSSQVTAALGLSDAQIEELAQSEITLAFKGISAQQFVPIPFFMVVINNDKPELMQQVVDTLVSRYRIPLREVSINGNSGISWGGVIGGSGLQPTLLFVDDYFVMASNIEQIEEFTADSQEESSLVTSAEFQRVDRGLQEENLSIAFLDFAELAEMLKELASWGGTMIAIKDRDLARRSKIIIDRLIIPILDGLSMYPLIGTRSYAQDDHIIFESTTAIDYGKESGKTH